MLFQLLEGFVFFVGGVGAAGEEGNSFTTRGWQFPRYKPRSHSDCLLLSDRQDQPEDAQQELRGLAQEVT